MASGRFSKQGAPYKTFALNGNNATGDTVIGGLVSAAPSGLNVSQFEQNLPGDRFIFTAADALALSNNSVGNLYGGTYRYVATYNNSSSSPALGHAAFWVNANNGANTTQDGLYQVTSDEPANATALFAGVFLNPMTKGNYWFIQESGKATCWFRNAITGTPAQDKGVYLALAGNNNNAIDVGAFDQLNAANGGTTFSAANSNTAYTAIDGMFQKYVGTAEGLPANNNKALVDIILSRASFRW